VVGTAFKKDGVFENSADQKRVADLMAVVKDYRSSLAAQPAAATG
jgi:predicted TIM-barrel enzyme